MASYKKRRYESKSAEERANHLMEEIHHIAVQARRLHGNPGQIRYLQGVAMGLWEKVLELTPRGGKSTPTNLFREKFWVDIPFSNSVKAIFPEKEEKRSGMTDRQPYGYLSWHTPESKTPTVKSESDYARIILSVQAAAKRNPRLFQDVGDKKRNLLPKPNDSPEKKKEKARKGLPGWEAVLKSMER